MSGDGIRVGQILGGYKEILKMREDCRCSCHLHPGTKHAIPCCNGAEVFDILAPWYKVKCDESNNPPESIERGELYADITLRPLLSTPPDLWSFAKKASECVCDCHSDPDIMHVAPCCYPDVTEMAAKVEAPVPQTGWGIKHEPNGGFSVIYPEKKVVETTPKTETRHYKFKTYTLSLHDVTSSEVQEDGRERLQTLSGRVIVVSDKWLHLEVIQNPPS